MMHACAATRLGAHAARLLEQPGRGRVVSLHAHAANIRLDTGRLVGVLPVSSPLHPWALAVPVDWRPEDQQVSVDVAWPVMRIGDVRIGLETATIAELRLAPCAGPLAAGLGEAMVRHAIEARVAGAFDTQLRRVVEEASGRRQPRGLAPLLGLGEGLTPSGDDLLVGILAAWQLSRASVVEAASWQAELGAALRPRLAGATTQLAGQLLEAALEEAFAEPVLELGSALQLGEREPLERAVAAVLDLGHRSGADLLWGVGVGLSWAEL